MSPSRFSAGITIGAPLEEMSSANVASINCGSYGDLGVSAGGGVHLLLEHPLVDRADRVLRPAEHLGARPLGLAERELRDRAADPSLDPLGPERDLVVAAIPPATPWRRTRRRRPCGRPRSARARRRQGARRGCAGRCGRSPCRRSPRAGSGWASRRRPTPSGRDRRRLEPEPVLDDRARRLVDDAVAGRAPALEGEVESREAKARGRSTSGCEHAQCGSSSSSCPVWSPSRITIVRASMRRSVIA